jgi:adenylate kinase
MTAKRFPAIILFGAPGVGKGTQGAMLNAIPGFRHVSSGDVFRALDPESPEGREVAQYAPQGKLVPDELTIRVFNAVLKEMIARGAFRPDEEILVLDGIPRTVPQAEILKQTTEVLAVVHFDFINDDVIMERIKRRGERHNRPDDADEATVRHRFEVYRRETEPVLQCFPGERVHRIDADAAPVEVARNLLDALIPAIRIPTAVEKI